MHVLYRLGLASPHGVLRKVGISMEGRRYIWAGYLFDTGKWDR
jgi:hypothetical protein